MNNINNIQQIFFSDTTSINNTQNIEALNVAGNTTLNSLTAGTLNVTGNSTCCHLK